MPHRDMTIDERRRYLMRTAKTQATTKFTASGRKREMKPITLPATPWKDDKVDETESK